MKFFSILILFSSLLFGIEATKGKSLLLTFAAPMGTIESPELNISVLLHPTDRNKGIAILPIDYYAQTTPITLTWHSPLQNLRFALDIQNGDYPVETLSVDPAKVTPPEEVLERISTEKAEAEAIYGHFTPIRYWNKPFIVPLDSTITSAYGSARTYNGVLKSYHGGVDLRARTPIPVTAANDGIVVLAKERYYSGGTIIIDHGEGLYSCYFHLSRFDVRVGDHVMQAQPIALTGATGRITGPHLHFGIMVHGIQTDPLDLIRQINALFAPEQVSPFEIGMSQ